MIEYVSKRKGEVRLLFSAREERDLFSNAICKINGVVSVDYKQSTRTITVKYREDSPASLILEHIEPKRLNMLDRTDIHFYISPFLKHPAVKLIFSMLMLGSISGIVVFGACSLFLVPYLKTKL
ncbi:MAG: hypothetical protein ACK4SM_03235 [Aquificaceae bacterium]